MMHPPENFAIVEQQLYRCKDIETASFPFCQTLQLTTLLSLNPDKPSRALLAFAETEGIEVVHLGLQPWRPEEHWRPLSTALVTDAMAYILTAASYPILVIDGNGAFMGILRKLQHWNFASVINEYRQCAGPDRATYINEQFMEAFDESLIDVDEQQAPEWFVSGEQLWREEAGESGAASSFDPRHG